MIILYHKCLFSNNICFANKTLQRKRRRKIVDKNWQPAFSGTFVGGNLLASPARQGNFPEEWSSLLRLADTITWWEISLLIIYSADWGGHWGSFLAIFYFNNLKPKHQQSFLFLPKNGSNPALFLTENQRLLAEFGLTKILILEFVPFCWHKHCTDAKKWPWVPFAIV